MTNYINDPQAIEKRSFEIITEELGDKTFSKKTDSIVKRVIHTTADFEYADLIEFKNDAVARGLKAPGGGEEDLRRHQHDQGGGEQQGGGHAGGGNRELRPRPRCGGGSQEAGGHPVHGGHGKGLDDDDVAIFAIGNAPTALYRLIQFIKEGKDQAGADRRGAHRLRGGGGIQEGPWTSWTNWMCPTSASTAARAAARWQAAILNAMLYKLGREW